MEKNDMIQPIDTSSKEQAMNAIQRKKELYEQMKNEAEQAQHASEQFHQQMRADAMNQPINDYNINDYNINEYGEIERSPKVK